MPHKKFNSWLSTFRRRSQSLGFDLSPSFNVRTYNDRVDEALQIKMPQGNNGFALLLGHSRELWPPFIQALEQRPELVEQGHPLDCYTEACLPKALEDCPVPWRICYSHTMPPDISFQKLADYTQIAPASPCRLNIHPVLGLWFGMRAVVSFAHPAQGDSPRPQSPCEGCSAPCVPAFEHAAAQGFEIKNSWKTWAAIRQVCPAGQGRHYGSEQLKYHYTADKEILRGALKKASNSGSKSH